eukprot:CAMPEP_0116850190 /NCGR_PEP_ID=MMETSP0418-20121206/16018_1 /TAXON_ID=1158023 /ORGANISM="Astrosyne radiata, Strain 13vi08-1A" /LENGTH=257 /DNA_ID=CAMNT_0004482051 /DNA_START=20 /DNA_END=797 /DNA_ORIENTATION=-
MAACPVAAIRVEHSHPDKELTKKMSLRHDEDNARPFPRLLTDNVTETMDSRGYTPYGKSAVEAVTSLTGPNGPDYLVLTHVDDTAGHGQWKERFPNLKRIFHSGDLGSHNWIGDETLEKVEILLPATTTKEDGQLQAFDLDGNILSPNQVKEHKAVLYHTPGHSPGSICMHLREEGVLFTGDTLGYTTRTNTLTAFPMYGNDRMQQQHTLKQLEQLDWHIVAPGHGHARDYNNLQGKKRSVELKDAIQDLQGYQRYR